MPMQRDTRQLAAHRPCHLSCRSDCGPACGQTVFGGIGRQGPHTNSGWLALMVAMGCLPTGTLTLALALAKLIGDRKRSPKA